MSNVKIDFKRLARLEAVFTKAIRDPSTLRAISEFLRSRIYQYTKRGFSLVDLRRIRGRGGKQVGDPKKLKALSPGYIEMRKAALKDDIKAHGRNALGFKRKRKDARQRALKNFGPYFNPARSNLTLTGQMLEALESDSDPTEGTIKVYVSDSSRDDSELSNADVAKKVSEEGRPFVGIDRVGRDRIKRMVIAQLRRSLKRR